MLQVPVPHSAGLTAPALRLPPLACDSHMHIFDPRFAASAHWTRQPPVATVDTYRRLQQRIGTTRAVVVTPSTYGTDNACTLDALRQLGGDARGVAVVDHDVPQDELQRLAAHGVCGVRMNFVTPQSWGPTTPRMLAVLAARCAPLGWHMQVLAHPEQWLAMAPLLHDLPLPLVIDHIARLEPRQDLLSPAVDLVEALLAGGNTWLKLSGAYMRSASGGPAYADTLPLGRRLAYAAPHRMLWGSDWPHTTEPAGTVDDTALIDLLMAWCNGDASLRNRILVDNPARLYGFPSSSNAAA